jgi:hypothetical protein
MAEQGITSISQLPTPSTSQNPISNPNVNPSANNITFSQNEIISETTSQLQYQAQPPPSLHQQQHQQQQSEQHQHQHQHQHQQQSQQNYNEMIDQLQKVSASGATSLPSRDIPSDPTIVANDVQTKPNFIPETSHHDYISNMQTPGDLIQQNDRLQMNTDTLDVFYNEFQLPILLAILYFMFQLPVFRKTTKTFFPSLFGNDANPNFYGYIFNSVLFASTTYSLTKAINHASQWSQQI